MKEVWIALAFLTAGSLTACQTTPSSQPKDPAGEIIRGKVQASMLDAAQASESREDFGSALAYYRSAYERDPAVLEAAVGLARTLRRMGRPREAMIIAERGLELQKRAPDLMAELGKSQLAANDTLEAIETLSRTESLVPEDWRIQSAIGVGYDRLGMHDDAEHWYQKALKLVPSNAVVLNNYALSLAQAGKLDKAIASLEKAAVMPESEPRIRQNLALLHATNGDFEAARDLVRQDLSGDEAQANLVYYRRLARRNRKTRTGLRLERPPLTSGQIGDIPLTLLPKPSVADETAAAPAHPVAPVESNGLSGTAIPAARDTTTRDTNLEPSPEGEEGSINTATAPLDTSSDEGSEVSSVVAASGGGRIDEAAASSGGESSAKDNVPSPKVAPATENDPGRLAVNIDQADDVGSVDATKDVASTSVPMRRDAEGSSVPAPTKPSEPDARGFRVQLGSYRSEEAAKTGISVLRGAYGDILIDVELDISAVTIPDSGEYFRVLTVALPSRVSAAEICRQLRSRDANCLIVQLR